MLLFEVGADLSSGNIDRNTGEHESQERLVGSGEL
jgi:hypothetical protein